MAMLRPMAVFLVAGVTAAYGRRWRQGNGNGAIARSSPQAIGKVPHPGRAARRRRDQALSPARCAGRKKAAVQYRATRKETAMPNERHEPNAELHHSFEPLRTTFAVLALLLGLAAAMHF
jgi:hypothetical protein